MKATHTPGPWWVGDDDASSVFAEVADQQVERIGTTVRFGCSLGEELANARMFAAAHDLLEALELVACWAAGPNAINDPVVETMIFEVNAAIRKARGE